MLKLVSVIYKGISKSPAEPVAVFHRKHKTFHSSNGYT